MPVFSYSYHYFIYYGKTNNYLALLAFPKVQIPNIKRFKKWAKYTDFNTSTSPMSLISY